MAIQKFLRKHHKKEKNYLIYRNILDYKCKQTETNRIVLPEKLKTVIMFSSHKSVFSGHLGKKKTISRIKKIYFWPTMVCTTLRIVLKFGASVNFKNLKMIK